MLIKLYFYGRIFEKYSYIKFHENPGSVSRVVPCGRTYRQTHMTKLIIVFHNSANAPKNCTFCPRSDFVCSVWDTQQTAIISLYSIN